MNASLLSASVLADVNATDASAFDVIRRHEGYLVLFAIAFAAAIILTPMYVGLAGRANWVDRPGGRKRHAENTPTMGGLVVFFVVFAGLGIVLATENRFSATLHEHIRYLIGAAACTGALLVVGVIDDLHGLRASIKFLVQFVLAMTAFLLGFRVSAVTIPGLGSQSLGPISFVVSVLWIVGVTNAINLADGLDGLAIGVSFLAAATNVVVAIYLHNDYMAVTMALLAGALLGFLRWNFHPARVFIGNAGSLGLGMFLALCSLHSAQKGPTVVMILIPLCALGYPIFDTLLAVARRTISGQPLFASDRQHIHHRLLERGHGESGAALRIYAGSLAAIAVCVLMSSMNHLVVGVGLAAALGLALFSVRVLGYMEWGGWHGLTRGRERVRRLHAAAELARLKIGAATTPGELLEALGVFAAEIGLSAIELDYTDETHRWVRYGASTAARTAVDVSMGGHCGRVECDVNGPLDERAAALWDELRQLAGERLDAWTAPASATVSR